MELRATEPRGIPAAGRGGGAEARDGTAAGSRRQPGPPGAGPSQPRAPWKRPTKQPANQPRGADLAPGATAASWTTAAPGATRDHGADSSHDAARAHGPGASPNASPAGGAAAPRGAGASCGATPGH